MEVDESGTTAYENPEKYQAVLQKLDEALS
jgi:hypothetical protein